MDKNEDKRGEIDTEAKVLAESNVPEKRNPNALATTPRSKDMIGAGYEIERDQLKRDKLRKTLEAQRDRMEAAIMKAVEDGELPEDEAIDRLTQTELLIAAMNPDKKIALQAIKDLRISRGFDKKEVIFTKSDHEAAVLGLLGTDRMKN